MAGDSDGESEALPPSFMDALSAVYKYLPEEVCPSQPEPPPRVRSLFEADTQVIPKELPKLPFSPMVGLLVQEIECHLEEEGKRAGTYVPKGFTGHQGTSFYVPLDSSWPVKLPSVDKDAGLIRVTKPPTPAQSMSKVWDN